MDYTIRWTEVRSILAYKKDLMTEDEVWMDVFCDGEKSFSICEEVHGWFQFVERSKIALPDIDPKWDFAIILEAFATNLTLVYDREKRTLDEVVKAVYK